MEVREVEWGIANNYGDYIEINKSLKKYPQLYNPILKHELEHTDKFSSKQDLMLDFGESRINLIDLLIFMLYHPKSLTQFLPFVIKKKKFYYDLNMIMTWGVMLLSVGAVFILSNKYL